MTDQEDLGFLGEWTLEFARMIRADKDLLTALDAAVGDGDHGINMHRGMTAVLAVQDTSPTGSPAALLEQVGFTLFSAVGGASGPLYATFFLRMAAIVARYPEGLGGVRFARAIQAGVDGIARVGKAELGNKTMYDSLAPAAAALTDALADGVSPTDALQHAAKAAQRGRDSTTTMCARKGRAGDLGHYSVGHQDPGATSAALLITALTVPDVPF